VNSEGSVNQVIHGFTVDRNSPIPLYFQVAQHLEQGIESGAIPNGTLFENEVQLAGRLGLSRPTMRRALEHLVDRGLIVRRRGVGTRVVRPNVRRPMELTSLYDDLVRSGQAPSTKVLDIDTVEADDELASRLTCAPGDPLLRIVRLRSAGGTPIAKMANFLPESVGTFESQDLEDHGLYELMRGRGIQLHSATQIVGARNATATESRLLGESRGAALLTMERVTYDDHGQVVEYGSHIYAASRYSFETHLLSP